MLKTDTFCSMCIYLYMCVWGPGFHRFGTADVVTVRDVDVDVGGQVLCPAGTSARGSGGSGDNTRFHVAELWHGQYRHTSATHLTPTCHPYIGIILILLFFVFVFVGVRPRICSETRVSACVVGSKVSYNRKAICIPC